MRKIPNNYNSFSYIGRYRLTRLDKKCLTIMFNSVIMDNDDAYEK